MRVIHVDSGREMRGGQWQVLRLHRELLATGHKSFLLAKGDSALLWAAKQEGLPADSLRLATLGALSTGYDIIHAHDSRSHTLCALLARVPLVVSRRVAFAIGESLASRLKYRQPSLFIAISHHVARQLRGGGIENRRIRVVYDGVPLPEHASAGNGLLIPETTDPAKGMTLAEEAAKIAGIPATLSPSLETDLPGAGKMLYITHSEGLGSGILLAMAYGVTVIASNTGGIPEIINDCQNGYLVENQAAGIAAALRNAVNLGAAARRTIEDRFTVRHMMDGTLAAYEQALLHG